MLKSATSLGMFLISVSAAAAQSQTTAFDNIQSVYIQNTSGKIDIKAEGTKVSVTTDKINFGTQCELNTKADKGQLFIEAKKKSFFASDCVIDFLIRVPRATNLQILNGSGDVSINDVSGKVRFNLASGSLHANAPLHDFYGETGAGDIMINNAAGPGKLQTGSGAIMINFIGKPTGRLQLESGSGDMTVVLNKNVEAYASLSSGSGKLQTENPVVPGAPFLIDANSGSGNLTVLNNPN